MSNSATAHAPLIIDIAGQALTEKDCQRLAHPLVGGVILFARNWQNRQQLTQLTAAMRAIRADLLICVDHEGGRVQRFRSDGFTHLPPMRTLGAMWDDATATQANLLTSHALHAMNIATATGYVLAAELRACGIDFSFTPVLDLDFGTSNVIGDRAFHHNPLVAAALAQSLMHGLRQAGMGNCGKHFPGHGYVSADSHTEIPVDERDLATILQHDSLPYRWLNSSLSGVMPAHVIYPKVDPRPAGFSHKWLAQILRAELGFQGAIFSDDLSMEGARQIDGALVSYTQAGVTALEAGCDLVLLCNQSLVQDVTAQNPIDALLDGLTQAQQLGHWKPSAASELRRCHLLPQTPFLQWDALMQSAVYLHAKGLLPV